MVLTNTQFIMYDILEDDQKYVFQNNLFACLRVEVSKHITFYNTIKNKIIQDG